MTAEQPGELHEEDVDQADVLNDDLDTFFDDETVEEEIHDVLEDADAVEDMPDDIEELLASEQGELREEAAVTDFQEEREPDSEAMPLRPDERAFSGARLRVLAVGVGGGGSRILQAAAGIWGEHVLSLVVDCDMQAIRRCEGVEVLPIQGGRPGGCSTGGDAELGREVIEEALDAFKRACAGMDVVILVAALGGGMGSGGAPLLAKAAHDCGAMVVGFATMPFTFEGKERQQRAQTALDSFTSAADVVILQPNDRLMNMQQDSPELQNFGKRVHSDDIDDGAEGRISIQTGFQVIDRLAAFGLQGLWELLGWPGLVNLDVGSLRAVADQGGGCCNMVYAAARGAQRAKRVVDEVRLHPLMTSDAALSTSPDVVIGIIGGEDLLMLEVQDIMDALRKDMLDDVRLIPGISVVPGWEGLLAVTVVAAEPGRMPRLEQLSRANEPVENVLPLEQSIAASKKRRKASQTKLQMAPVGRGRFNDVEPTLVNGQDLDIPTFRRRGLRLLADVETNA